MSKAQMMLYCSVCLLVSLGAAALLFPYAAMPKEKLAFAHSPQPMEALPDIDLGDGFGQVSVTELVGYYIENPPQPTGGTAKHVDQFGGC